MDDVNNNLEKDIECNCQGKTDCEDCSCETCNCEEDSKCEISLDFEGQFGMSKRYLFGPSHSVDHGLKTIDLQNPREDPS